MCKIVSLRVGNFSKIEENFGKSLSKGSFFGGPVLTYPSFANPNTPGNLDGRLSAYFRQK